MCFLSSCSNKEKLAFPGEDNIQPYVQKVLGFSEVADFDYSPSLEDFFVNGFKAKLFEEDIKYLKSAMSEEGILADENCNIYLPISQLSSICEGKTRIYLDETLVREFDSGNENGKSYSLLSEELTKMIMDYTSTATWFPESIRGKRIYTHFYMTHEDWLSAVADKDPFKYLCLDVYIKNDK